MSNVAEVMVDKLDGHTWCCCKCSFPQSATALNVVYAWLVPCDVWLADKGPAKCDPGLGRGGRSPCLGGLQLEARGQGRRQGKEHGRATACSTGIDV